MSHVIRKPVRPGPTQIGLYNQRRNFWIKEAERLYYHTSHKFAMLKLHRPEGENSYYHPAIISTIKCAALMRVQFVSVRRFISMTALPTHVLHHIIS